ncbi:hypothetical protein PFMC_05920, partial [Plasmodium falciparum CAMP/Malaysia]
PCPDCGVVKQNGGNFKVREETDAECQVKNDATPLDGVNITDIQVLYSGVERKDISEKLKDFCTKDNVSIIKENEKWKCYYINKDNIQCKMENSSQKVEGHSKIMKFDEFFTFWVTYMLNDCIDWKKKITKCINNGSAWRCKYGCKDNCDCFEKWVKKKQVEWNTMKEQYEKQTNLVNKYHFAILEGVLVLQFFPLIKKAYGNEDAIEKIKQFLDKKGKQEDDEIKDKRDIIDILLEHELDEAQECKDNNREEKNCSKEAHDDLDEEDDLDEDETHYNPCSAQPSGRYTVRVKDIAKQMHRRAKAQMRKNCVVDGDNKLEGDIFKVTFRNGGDGKGLDKDICNIDTKYSNDSRSHGEPCTGKDNGGERFKIGTRWLYFKENQKLYKEFYLPPRREHMCTSNLENLDVGSVTENGKAIHSLLGDVLLTAKMDAAEIIKRYAKQNGLSQKSDSIDAKHKESICRAVRYSFADIGDIIRGRDLWDEDKGAQEMEKHLQKIFQKIKEQIPEIQGKYNTDGKHKQLRADWWEANRRQVWQAIQCSLNTLKSSTADCKYNSGNIVPLDDYIPQRLRWMTEWAEWYCKVQKEAYEELVRDCGECKKNADSCTKGTPHCTSCDNQCKLYVTKIKKWEEQWNEIFYKYLILYRNAEITSPHGTNAYGGDVGDKDKPVAAFLQKLQEANKSSASKRSKRSIPRDTTSPYSSAAGYIHQELPYTQCQVQNQFCKKKHGEISSTATNNDKYAFMQPPKEYEKACICEKSMPKRVPTRPQEPWFYGWRTRTIHGMVWRRRRNNQKTTCDIVAEMLKDKNERTKVGESYTKENYPDWKCDDNKIKSGQYGACMPPRRQKLCLQYLEKPMKNTDGLKIAFLKCAAAETSLLWKKYKDDKKKVEKDNGTANDPDAQLNSGTIPDEFKRQMFYTFADYRDLCLDTDISSHKDTTKGICKVKYNIYDVFYKIRQSSISYRKNWWEKNGPEIWKGMLCALEKTLDDKKKLNDKYKYESVTFGDNSGPNLQTFSSRPQFLRWFTEWGEDFCKKQKKELVSLKKKCDNCTVSDSGTKDNTKMCNNKENCDACKTACTTYQSWIEKWKTQYKTQSKKYKDDKGKEPYKSIDEVKNSPNAFEYLDKQLKQFTCVSGDCNCMENSSKQQKQSSTDGDKMPESLDEKPKEVKEKCNCVPDECNALSISGSGFPDVSVFGGGVSEGKCNKLKGGLPEKSVHPPYDPTNDILKTTIPVGIALALGSIAFLFIKK